MRIALLTFRADEDLRTTGWTICSDNHIRRIAKDSEVDLTVIAVARSSLRAELAEHLRKLDVKSVILPMGREHMTVWERCQRRLKRTYMLGLAFTGEDMAIKNPDLARRILEVLRRLQPDLLLVEYLPLFALLGGVPRGVPTAVITVNREAEFFRHMHKANQQYGWRKAIAGWRMERFEREVHKCAHKIITIGPPDIPDYIDPQRAACITPNLDEADAPWQLSKSRSAFFVGNMRHYPNRRAIEFVATRLAPFLLRADPTIKLKIVGVSELDVAATWRHANVLFLGLGDSATPDALFRHEDLMLCPVDNTFGMKFKVAEAIASGTPTLVSNETGLCIPHIPSIPRLPLDDPAAWAATISRLVNNPSALIELHETIKWQARNFATGQANIWSKVLKGVQAEPRVQNL
jgi:glycosyltransferase involved in cell wall biosynthesis